MKRFKEAARAAFDRSYAGRALGEGHVERLSVDVEISDQREIVSLRLSGERLMWSCTCGELECKHARTALEFLVDAEAPEAALAPHASDPLSDAPLSDAPLSDASLSDAPLVDAPLVELAEVTRAFDAPPLSTGADVRTVDESDQAAGADTAVLGSILEDVITAVVRSGVRGGVSPSIAEALDRMVAAAPVPLPLGISRWIGRLNEALTAHDADATARVLEGASRVIEDLSAAQPSGDARRRIVTWLGALTHETDDVERLSDRTMLEVAREWLPGVQRAGVERRYLVDLESGETFREERAGSAQTASLGSCPRVVNVGLAAVERGATPRRIRLLQYATTPSVGAECWSRLASWAAHSFEPLALRYREDVRLFPGLAEPFALVAPDSLSGNGTPVLHDRSGRPLPCAGDPAVLRHLEETAGSGDAPLWVTGRLVDAGGVLAIVPLSLARSRHGRICYIQM